MNNITYDNGRNSLMLQLSIAAGTISGTYLVIALLPPFLYKHNDATASMLRALGGAICHQMPSRSIWIRDFPCGLCAKCLGFYAGIFFSSALFILNKTTLTNVVSLPLSLLLAPILLDSLTGFTAKESDYYLYINFLLSTAAGFGLLFFLLNTISHGGLAMRLTRKCFPALLFVFIALDLYGFSTALGQEPPQAEPSPAAVVLPGGTGVILQVEGGITTKETREGDLVPLHVVSPVRVGNTVVIRGGTPARGVVAMARSASSWGGAGELVIEAKYVFAIDGSEVLVSGSSSRRGETSHGASAAAAVGAGILCLPLALTGAAVKGEEGRVLPGFELVARTLNDQTIRILSEKEQLDIQAQQEKTLREQQAAAAVRAQQMREEEERRKKKDKPSLNK